jgi:hypothetical protein
LRSSTKKREREREREREIDRERERGERDHFVLNPCSIREAIGENVCREREKEKRNHPKSAADAAAAACLVLIAVLRWFPFSFSLSLLGPLSQVFFCLPFFLPHFLLSLPSFTAFCQRGS